MAASGETAFRQVTDFGYSAGAVMSVVALSTGMTLLFLIRVPTSVMRTVLGFLYSGVSCDMNLVTQSVFKL